MPIRLDAIYSVRYEKNLSIYLSIYLIYFVPFHHVKSASQA